MCLGPKSHGFTLIEVLIALAIFSVMSMMAYGGLKTILNARNGTERAAERLREVQMAFVLIQQDMQHMMPRSISNENDERELAMEASGVGDYLIAFTRGGNRNLRRPKRSGLYRVAYQLEDGELKRFVWYTLDRAQGNTPQEMVLLRGVTELDFSEIGQDVSELGAVSDTSQTDALKYIAAAGGKALASKIAKGLESDDKQESRLDDKLPQSVEVMMVLEDFGTITRLFAMPQ